MRLTTVEKGKSMSSRNLQSNETRLWSLGYLERNFSRVVRLTAHQEVRREDRRSCSAASISTDCPGTTRSQASFRESSFRPKRIASSRSLTSMILRTGIMSRKACKTPGATLVDCLKKIFTIHLEPLPTFVV